jgi:hypothetical protein
VTVGDSTSDDHVPRCPVCRYRPLPGPTYLCLACLDHLGADLLEIAKLAARLDARPSVCAMESRGPPGFRSRPPGRVDVWVARDPRSKPYPVVEEWFGRDRDEVDDLLPSHEDDRPIRGVVYTLSSWAALIAESRGFTTALPTSVDDLCTWLSRQSDYIGRWPDDGPTLAVDIRAQRNQLRSLTGDPNPKPAAWCIRLVAAAGGEPVTCGAPIFLPRGQTEIDHTQPLKLRCGGDAPHVFSGMELLHLKLANDREKETP